MTRWIVIGTMAAIALGASACTESKRARDAATWGDKPAEITCWTYGTQNYAGRSTGKVEYDDGGRLSFVDAANGRYTTIEGDCRIVYLADKDDAAPVVAPAVPVPPKT